MRKVLLAIAFLLVFFEGYNAIVSKYGGINTAYASTAIAVQNDEILVGQDEYIIVGLMGVKIDKEENSKAEDGVAVLTRYGHTDPRVDRLMLYVNGKSHKVRNVEIIIKAYQGSNSAGLPMDTVIRKQEMTAGEKLSLDYSYNFPVSAKFLGIEVTLSNEEGFATRARYNLEIV